MNAVSQQHHHHHEHEHEHGHGHEHEHEHGHEHGHEHEQHEHSHIDHAQLSVRRLAARLVLVLGLALALLWHWDPERASYATLIFLGITLEAAPWILAAALLTLAMESFLRDDWLPRLTRRSGWWGLPLVCAAAPLIPTCECGVVVLLRGLIRKGLPIPHAITFLLIAPILNPIVLLSTWVAFADWSMALWRGGMAMAVAIAVGSIFWRSTPQQALVSGDSCGHEHHHSKGFGGRAEKVLGDVYDTFLFFLFGVGLATTLRVLVPVATLDGLGSDPILAPMITMTLAFVASLCSEADAFLAAGLHGFSAAALLAFLVFGPMCDVKLLLMLRTVMKPVMIAKVMLTTALLVYIAALFAHLVYGG